MICLLVLTDGRDDLLARSLASAKLNLSAVVSRCVIHDDTGDPAHRAALQQFIAGLGHSFLTDNLEVIGADTRLGFGGAIANAWAHLNATAEGDLARFTFHLEDDFVIERPVPLTTWCEILDRLPYLQQIALLRQPWNDAEIAAGGIVEQHPDWYHERHWAGQAHWLEHRVCFTTNPSLYRRSLCWRGWPTGEHSEGLFTHELLADESTRFAYWGYRGEKPWVTHVGDVRMGTGY